MKANRKLERISINKRNNDFYEKEKEFVKERIIEYKIHFDVGFMRTKIVFVEKDTLISKVGSKVINYTEISDDLGESFGNDLLKQYDRELNRLFCECVTNWREIGQSFNEEIVKINGPKIIDLIKKTTDLLKELFDDDDIIYEDYISYRIRD